MVPRWLISRPSWRISQRSNCLLTSRRTHVLLPTPHYATLPRRSLRRFQVFHVQASQKHSAQAAATGVHRQDAAHSSGQRGRRRQSAMMVPRLRSRRSARGHRDDRPPSHGALPRWLVRADALRIPRRSVRQFDRNMIFSRILWATSAAIGEERPNAWRRSAVAAQRRSSLTRGSLSCGARSAKHSFLPAYLRS
jgi:hypothetical protein